MQTNKETEELISCNETYYCCNPWKLPLEIYSDPCFDKQIESILSDYSLVSYSKNLYELYNKFSEFRENELLVIECKVDFANISKRRKINLGENCIIEALHFNYQRFPYNEIKPKNREQKHLQDLESHKKDTSYLAQMPKALRSFLLQDLENHNKDTLLLSGTPESYLAQMPKALRPFLFIDYKLFNRYFEHWRHYDERESDSVLDLYMALVMVVIPNWSPISPDFKLTLNHIKELHEIASFSLFYSRKQESGKLRNSPVFFPLTIESTTVEGLTELLLHIKNNEQDHFAIGKYYNLDVFEIFIINMQSRITQNYLEEVELLNGTDANTRKEQLDEFIKKQVQEFLDCRSFNELETQEVKTIIQQGLKSHAGFFNSLIDDKSTSLKALLRYNLDNILKTPTHSQEEHNLYERYSRKKGYNKDFLNNLTDAELKELANKLYVALENGDTINVYPPSPDTLEGLVQQAIDAFNKDIQTAYTVEQKIDVIDTLIHELEINHLFNDGNCRTGYLLLNELLIKCGIKWSILYDPNRFDGYSKEQRMAEIKLGIARFAYIIANKESILSQYEEYEQPFLVKKSSRQMNFFLAPELFALQNDTKGDSLKEAEQIFDEVCGVTSQVLYRNPQPLGGMLT